MSGVLERIGAVKSIILIGDYAQGIDSGTIEVFLVGGSLNTDYINQLEAKIEAVIDRKIHFYLTQQFNFNKKHIILYEDQ